MPGVALGSPRSHGSEGAGEEEGGTITVHYDLGAAFANKAMPMVLAKPSPWEPYIDEQGATAVFDAVADGQGRGSIQVGKVAFRDGRPIEDLSGYRPHLLSYIGDGEANHLANPGKFERNWFKVCSDGGSYNYQYAVRTSEVSEGQASASLEPLGAHPVARSEVLGLLGASRSFAVVSNALQIRGDMEGNVATRRLMGSGELGITSSVTAQTRELRIKVHARTEEPGAPVALALHEKASGEAVDRAELVSDDRCRAEHCFTVAKDAFSASDVYYVTSSIAGEEAVSDDVAVEPSAIMGTENVSFARSVEADMVNGKNDLTDHLVSVSGSYPGRGLTLRTVSEEEFDATLDIGRLLQNATALSRKLASAASNEEYSVYRFKADDISGGKRIAVDYDDATDAVINVAIPSSTERFTISPDTFFLGSHNVSDGQT